MSGPGTPCSEPSPGQHTRHHDLLARPPADLRAAQVEDVDLGLAAPDIPVPPVITLIRGQLIDVDKQLLLKTKP
jgi:hypothetical protein